MIPWRLWVIVGLVVLDVAIFAGDVVAGSAQAREK